MNDTDYFEQARLIAAQATCSRAKCGAVVVSAAGDVIGRGYNAPPLGDESQRMCDIELDKSIKQNNDKTCCVHAEWNAIFDAMTHHSDQVKGATLYFMRVDDQDRFTEAGDPYCTVCSRIALQMGLKSFVLWNKQPQIFSAAEYNKKSYEYFR